MRVLVEGAVIVGSILLAFGIDAWWDRSQQRGQEQELLEGLEADFVSSMAALDETIRLHRLFAERAGRLESMSDSEVRALPPDSVEPYIRAVSQYMTYEPQGGTLHGLVGSGQLSLLEDAELPGLLAAWQQGLDDMDEEAEFLTSTAREIAIRIARVARPGPDLTPEHFLTMIRDEETLALMRSKIFFGQLYLGELEALRAHGEAALVAVRASRDVR